MIHGRVSEFVPTVTRAEDGHVTINWNTPTGLMPRDGPILVAAELIAEWIQTMNALVDAEQLLGIRK